MAAKFRHVCYILCHVCFVLVTIIFSLCFSGGTDLENPFSFTFTKGGNISEKTCYTNMKNLSEKAFFCNRFQLVSDMHVQIHGR